MAVWGIGIIGAGLGTIIGMAVGAIPLLLFFNKKQALHFGKPEFKVKEILFAMANGSSEAVTNLSTAVTTALFNIQMMQFAGAKGVAAISAILYIHFIFTAVSFGFTSGVSPIISFNYGAQNHEKLQKLFRLCIKITLIISLAMIAASEILQNRLSEFSRRVMRSFSRLHSADSEFLQSIICCAERIFLHRDFLPHSTTARFQP